MRHRGITLMELLLACALFLVLGAIALPAMLESSEHARLNEAAEAIEEQLLLARAHAMVEGVSVEVHWDSRARRVEVLDASAAEVDDAASERIGQQVEQPGTERVEERPAALLPRHWATVALPEGVMLSLEAPAVLAGDEADSGGLILSREADADDPGLDADVEEVLMLVMYLPDGSAPVAEAIWLSTEDGRAMRIDVGRWTGIPHIERDPVADELDAEEEQAADDGEDSTDDGQVDEDTIDEASDEEGGKPSVTEEDGEDDDEGPEDDEETDENDSARGER